MDSIPDYVQIVLDEWETLAFYAYDNYERFGGILVGMEENPDVPSGIQLVAITYDYENGKPDDCYASTFRKELTLGIFRKRSLLLQLLQ